MSGVPVELLGKALAETLRGSQARFGGAGVGGGRDAFWPFRRAAQWLRAAFGRAVCPHGFAKDCPTCAHFAKVREAEQ